MSAPPDRPWLASYDPGVPASLDYPDWTVPDLLDRAAASRPDAKALSFFVHPRFRAPSLTYAEFRERSLRFATALYQLGVRKGDRVAIMLPNCPQYAIAFYGALRLGAIVVNTNPLYVAREMRQVIEDAGCETLILLDRFFPRFREIRGAVPVKRAIVVDVAEVFPRPLRTLIHLAETVKRERVRVRSESDIYFMRRLLRRYPPTPPRSDALPDDLALFQFTGGTTGISKAAMLTHRNLVANTRQLLAWFPDARTGEEVMLAAIPFFHVFGMTVCLLCGTAFEAEIVALPRPRPVDLVMQAIGKHRATILPGVPALFASILDHPHVGRYDLRSVRYGFSGAAPLPTDVQKRFEALSGSRVIEGYGLTEASPVTHGNPFVAPRREASIGLPLPDVEARILDPATHVPLPVGEQGELAVRGPQVMQGYWGKPEDTEEILRDGWLLTGDIARMDADGFFYVVDRKKDMINASGFKVLPREVEDVVRMHTAVRDVAVAGVPDRERGEVVKAYVVLKEGAKATEEEIVAFCRLHLAPFKVPRRVDFRDDLPRTLVGKVLRRVLQEEERKREG